MNELSEEIKYPVNYEVKYHPDITFIIPASMNITKSFKIELWLSNALLIAFPLPDLDFE